MTLKLFTLNNGLEIMGKLVDSRPTDAYIIEQPLGIHAQFTGPDTYGLAFRPASAADPEGYHKYYFHAISSECINIPVELEKAYIQYTSKIIIASSI